MIHNIDYYHIDILDNPGAAFQVSLPETRSVSTTRVPTTNSVLVDC